MTVKNIFKFVAIILPLVFSQGVAAFANATYTYDGSTYPGDDEDHGGTRIDATNTDIVAGALNGNVVMTGGKLQLYTGFIVNGTINSDVSGENELQFEQSYNLGGNIGNNNYFGLTALQNSASVDLNQYTLYVKELFINGGTISDGRIAIHENGFIDGIAGFAASDVEINGEDAGFGAIHFVRDNQDPGVKRINNNIGSDARLNNIQLSASGEDNVVDFGGYTVNSNSINIQSGAVLITSGANVNSNIIIANDGILEVTAKHNFVEDLPILATISGTIKGLSDGVGMVNIFDGFTLNGNIGSASNSLAEVKIANNFADDNEFDDGDFNVNLSIYNLDVNVIKIGNGGNLITGTGTITGEIRGETAGFGNLVIAENFTTSSNIGENANLNSITVNAGKTFTINHAISSSSMHSSGTIDFGETNQQMDVHIYGAGTEGVPGTATFNARNIGRTINGNFETTGGDILAMNINSVASSGSFAANARAIVASGTKLDVDISGFELAGVTAGGTVNLVSGNENSIINQISSDDIDIGAGYGGSKSVGALTFGTVIDGDSLKLVFTQNTSLRTIDVDNIDVTPAFDLVMNEAAVVIQGNGNLNLGPSNIIANGNVTIGSDSSLSVGAATINGFITGSTAGAGTLNINGEGTFVSNGDIGYGLSLAAVNVAAGKTLDIRTNNNFINASAINLGSNSILNAGTGAINGAITLGVDSTLTYGASVVNGGVNGVINENIVTENSEAPQFQYNGTLIMTNSASFNAGVGTRTTQVSGSTVFHGIRELNLQDSEAVHTYNLNNLNAIELKVGSNAVVNFNGDVINVDRIIDSTLGVSSLQTLNIANSTLNMADEEHGITLARNSIINIGNNSTINGDINQLNQETLESSVINISGNFVSNGNFTSNNGAMNLLAGADLNLATNSDAVSGYNISLSDGSTLTVGTDSIASSSSINGSEVGNGDLVVADDFTYTSSIGATHALNSVTVNAGKTMNAGNIDADNVIVNGKLKLQANNIIDGDLLIAQGATLEVDNSPGVIGAISTNSGSSFNSSITTTIIDGQKTHTYGSIGATGLATISAGTLLKLDLSLADLDIGTRIILISGATGSQISAIANGDIFINGNRTNKIDLVKYETMVSNEAESVQLSLNVTQITESLNIAAADGETYNYSAENPLENATNTGITNYVATNLIDEGATLSMGSGEIRRNVNIAQGAVLNTGSGAINGNIAALDGNSQGTVNVRENLELNGNIGAEDRAINLLEISADKTLTANQRNIIVTEVKINGDATLQIDGRLNEDDTITYGILAANSAGTEAVNILLGQSVAGDNIAQGTLDIYNATDESINANINGSVAGSGDVILRRSGTLSNLVIGATTRINQLSIMEDVNISLGSNVSANIVYVNDGSSLNMLDGTTTTLNDRLIVDGTNQGANFYLGETGGEGATLTGSAELTGGDGAYFNVNSNSTINGDVVFTDSGFISFLEGSTLNGGIFSKNDFNDETIGGNNGDVYISDDEVTITGDINGIRSFNVNEGATFAIASNQGNTDITASEINIYGESSFTTNSALTAANFEIHESSSLTTSGRISGGPVNGEGYFNAAIKLGNNSTLTLNSSSSLHATIDDHSENEGRIGHGALVFGDAQEENTYDLYGNIGGNFGIASIAVGQNVAVDADLVMIKTDSLSLGQNANLTTVDLFASNVTVDTKDITKGIVSLNEDTVALDISASLDSSLNIISGLVTGYARNIVRISDVHNSTTSITVGQDVLRGAGDSGAVLSNTNTNTDSKIINLANVSGDITVTINNKATGSIQTNSSDVITLTQNAEREVAEITENVNAILNITNAGTITSGSSSVNAINSNFRSTITNSGEITGKIALNSVSQATLTNSGTITGDVEISSGSSYDEEENAGGSYISMTGGEITGNIKMNNAGTSLRATGGTITGNVTMHHNDQYVRFNGGTLSGNITSDIAEVNHAGTVYIGGNGVAIGGISKVADLVINNDSTFNAGASNISVASIDIEEGSTLQTTSGDIIAAAGIDIKGGATLSINNSAINLQNAATYTTLAANSGATQNAAINLGRRITVDGAEDGTLSIGTVANNSIRANVNAFVAGHGNVKFTGNASLNNFSIGSDTRINQLSIEQGANVVLGSSVSATNVNLQTSEASTTNLAIFGNLTATEAVTLGANAYLEANANITASTLNIADGSIVVAAGRISGAASGGGFNTATIKIGLNSTLNLNDGSSLYAAIDGNTENPQDSNRGEVVFKASNTAKTYNLYADIGNNHGIAAISVESNIAINASEVSIKTDSLLLQQNSNLTADALYSSNVTVDTNNLTKGIVSTTEDDPAIYLNTQSLSTLNIISGLVTGVNGRTLELNTAANASTGITVGQNVLEDGDSNAKLSNTAEGNNIINHTGVTNDISVTITNNATGTIQTNSGTVINLAQEATRVVDEETQQINATLNLTNAGTITSGSSSVYAINTNFRSIVTNTGTITGKINLNSLKKATLTNSGTITGNIEISGGSEYNAQEDDSRSLIETSGTITGNIEMYNAGAALKATGGTITGNITMYDNDQYIRFSGGGDLDGNISSAGIVYISANNTSIGRISDIASLIIDNEASFTATANIGASSVNLENNTSLTTSKNISASVIVLKENASLSQTAGDMLFTTMNIGGNSSLTINNSAINLEDDATYTTLAANAEGTESAAINLGQRTVDEEVQNATFNIGNVANNSIRANVNGIDAGQGNVVLSENVTLNNLSIGADKRINKFEISSANVVFGSSVSANTVLINDGSLAILDGATTTTNDRLIVNASAQDSSFTLGQQDGAGATLLGAVELRSGEGFASFNVNKNSTITGAVTFTGGDYVRIDFMQGSTLNGGFLSKDNYSDEQSGGDNGDVYIQGNNVSITGNINGISSFNVEQNVAFNNNINIKSFFINLYSNASLETTSELTAGNILIDSNASITTSGKIWNGYSDEEGYRNSAIKLGNNATLTLNSNPNLPNGTRLYATIDDHTENQNGVGNGKVVFTATQAESLYSLSGNIGGNYKIAAIEVGENVRIDGYNTIVKTDSLSLAQNSSITNAFLSSSTVTIDTNDITKGLIHEHDSTALNLNTKASSSLTLTSGLVTGVSNYVLRINANDSAITAINIGQDALAQGDSAAMLSNTASGNNVIYLDEIDSSIALTINNKATGTISANEGGVIHLTQAQDKTSAFTLNNAGSITSGARSVSAINTNFNSNITNTGTIVGGITLNASQQARLSNNGTITGDIAISGGSSYNPDNGEGASYIHMNGGAINGNINMQNAGTNLIANGGTITGNVAFNHASQFIHFNGGALHGNITSETIGRVIVDDATFTKATTTTINAATFTTNENSFLSLTANSASASLVIIGEAIIAPSTTIKLSIAESVTKSSTFTLIDATTYSGGALEASRIRINGLEGSGSNAYGGLNFATRIENNKLILFTLESQVPIFRDLEDQKIYEVVNNVENTTGELAIIQDYLTNAEVSVAQKERVLNSLTPAVDRGSNTVITDNNISLANLNSARLSDSSAATAIVESSFVSNLFGRSSRVETLEPLRDNNIKAATPLAMAFKGDDLLGKAVWIQTFGSNINQGNTASGKGYKANSGGLALGIDQKVNNDLTVGLSSSYSKSNIKSNDTSKSTEIETYQASIYTGYSAKSYFINASLGLSLNSYTSSRGIAIAGVTARANYSGKSYFARAELGKNFKFENNLTIAPSIMMTAARNSVEQYQETGAGTSNLNIKNKNTDFLEGRATLEVSKLFETANKTKIRPQVSLSYGYDFVGDEQKTTSNFVGQNTSFDSTSANVAQGSLKLGTGVGFYTQNDLTVSLNYGLEKRIDYTAHSGWIRLRRGF